MLSVENSNGGVNASDIKGSANVKTSFGPVVLREVGGGLTVNSQNGSIEASGLRLRPSGAGGCNDVDLKTSFAPMRVFLPNDASYKINAKTTFGRIESDLPMTVAGGMRQDQIVGTIGSGECLLNLTNSNSNISLYRKN
jgi:DUF4097 and DUF4098 domain-containing protein YvlB